MRRARLLSVLLAALIAAGCDSGGDDGGIIVEPPPEIEGSMSAEVSGKAFEADSLVGAWFIGTTLVIEGADSTGRSIRVALRNAEGTGTFAIAGLQSEAASATYWSSVQEFLSVANTPGTLTITRLDTLAVRGTFQFLAENLGGSLVAVEQGQFLAPRVDPP